MLSGFDRGFVTSALICRLSCSSVIALWSPFLIPALSCSALLIVPVRPTIWCMLCRLLFWSYLFDPCFDIRSVVFYFWSCLFDHPLPFDIRSVVFWFHHTCLNHPPFWYTLCRVLFWSYLFDPCFDIRSVVLCFDHTCLTPHFDIPSVVFCFDHTCLIPTLIYFFPSPS